jgi:hypothetical protein
MITVSENTSSPATPDPPAGPDGGLNHAGVSVADGTTRLAGTIVGHVTDQARRTASAAKARRVKSTNSEPGVLDLTPLRQLVSEFVEELENLRLRDRVARALRQAADIIDTRTPNP